jgi:hypothetical protein
MAQRVACPGRRRTLFSSGSAVNFMSAQDWLKLVLVFAFLSTFVAFFILERRLSAKTNRNRSLFSLRPLLESFKHAELYLMLGVILVGFGIIAVLFNL